jgi:hypothetical protein
MFRAHWRQVHIGPYLRGERDKRQYHQLFRASYGESWMRLPWLIGNGYRFKREDERDSTRDNGYIVTFDGMKDCFGSLRNQHDLIRGQLQIAAKTHVVSSLPVLPSTHIGVHVRCGDFAHGTENQLVKGLRNTRIPVSWYTAAIDALRRAIGAVPVYVYSDGDNDELSGLLRMSGVQRVSGGNALTDILSLCRASAIVASGSTFSAWASFLQQTPTIYHRGQLHYPTLAAAASEIEWLPGEPLNIKFVEKVSSRLSLVAL